MEESRSTLLSDLLISSSTGTTASHLLYSKKVLTSSIAALHNAIRQLSVHIAQENRGYGQLTI